MNTFCPPDLDAQSRRDRPHGPTIRWTVLLLGKLPKPSILKLMARFWEKLKEPRTDWQGNPISAVKWLIFANIVAFIPQTFFRVAHNPIDIVWFGLSWQGLKSFCLWQ